MAFPKCRVEIQQVDANNSSEIEQKGEGVVHWTCQGMGLLRVEPHISAALVISGLEMGGTGRNSAQPPFIPFLLKYKAVLHPTGSWA